MPGIEGASYALQSTIAENPDMSSVEKLQPTVDINSFVIHREKGGLHPNDEFVLFQPAPLFRTEKGKKRPSGMHYIALVKDGETGIQLPYDIFTNGTELNIQNPQKDKESVNRNRRANNLPLKLLTQHNETYYLFNKQGVRELNEAFQTPGTIILPRIIALHTPDILYQPENTAVDPAIRKRTIINLSHKIGLPITQEKADKLQFWEKPNVESFDVKDEHGQPVFKIFEEEIQDSTAGKRYIVRLMDYESKQFVQVINTKSVRDRLKAGEKIPGGESKTVGLERMCTSCMLHGRKGLCDCNEQKDKRNAITAKRNGIMILYPDSKMRWGEIIANAVYNRIAIKKGGILTGQAPNPSELRVVTKDGKEESIENTILRELLGENIKIDRTNYALTGKILRYLYDVKDTDIILLTDNFNKVAGVKKGLGEGNYKAFFTESMDTNPAFGSKVAGQYHNTESSSRRGKSVKEASVNSDMLTNLYNLSQNTSRRGKIAA